MRRLTSGLSIYELSRAIVNVGQVKLQSQDVIRQTSRTTRCTFVECVEGIMKRRLKKQRTGLNVTSVMHGFTGFVLTFILNQPHFYVLTVKISVNMEVF